MAAASNALRALPYLWTVSFHYDLSKESSNTTFNYTSTPRSHFRHKICRIWDHLASVAVAEGADLFVLLGDDIQLLTPVRVRASNLKCVWCAGSAAGC